MKNARINTIILHFIVGVGAMAGGLSAILNPADPMGIPLYVLQYSPFHSFMIPGIILFVCIGIFNVLSGVMVVINIKFNEYLPGLMGIIMAFWLIIQCLILRGINYLHVIFFIIAVIQGILSLYILYNKNMFPMNF